MRFEKTSYGWKAYRKINNAWVYFGHYVSKRQAREMLEQLKALT